MNTSIWNNSRNSGKGRGADQTSSNSADSWLGHLTSVWIADLQRTLENPGVEEVHRVRTGTRRLEAQLESLFERGELADGVLRKSAESWMRQMKKIRRAAGEVRDLDVHRKLMEKYTGIGKAGRKLHEEGKQGELEKSVPSPQEKTLLENQAELLDDWLRNRRDRYAARLRKQVEKRLPKVEKLSRRFFENYGHKVRAGRAEDSPASIALKVFVRVCTEIPQLNASTLHDFRKKIKKARYLTESARQSAKAKQVGDWIKKIQDSIGAWHDWLVLSEEASAALKNNDADLVRQLEEQVAHKYQEALKTTEKLKLRLLPSSNGR